MGQARRTRRAIERRRINAARRSYKAMQRTAQRDMEAFGMAGGFELEEREAESEHPLKDTPYEHDLTDHNGLLPPVEAFRQLTGESDG